MMQKVGACFIMLGCRATVSLAVGKLVVGWRLVHAEVARARLDDASEVDADYYKGKLASARFFCAEVLPELGADRRIIESGTLALMDVDEACF